MTLKIDMRVDIEVAEHYFVEEGSEVSAGSSFVHFRLSEDSKLSSVCVVSNKAKSLLLYERVMGWYKLGLLQSGVQN